MKYDDASWHSGGEFPDASPAELGGTHIALFLKWCFQKGWAGELHIEHEPEAVRSVVDGSMAATEFLFEYCDGKLTNDSLNHEGNTFSEYYYGDNGDYLEDYAAFFGDHLYVEAEAAHDFAVYAEMVEVRYQEWLAELAEEACSTTDPHNGTDTDSQPETNVRRKPWWRLW